MTIQGLAIEGMEQALDRVLALDPDTRRGLAGLHGKVIRLVLGGPALTLDLIPGEDGRINLFPESDRLADCTIRGTPFDLLRAGDSAKGHAELFSRRVEVSGDHGLARRFSELLGGLDIDWEGYLAGLIGDIPAHQISRKLGGVRHGLERIAASTGVNLAEYLSEESRVLPHRVEITEFVSAVDQLRDDVDRLEARINRSAQSRGRHGKPPDTGD